MRKKMSKAVEEYRLAVKKTFVRICVQTKIYSPTPVLASYLLKNYLRYDSEIFRLSVSVD